MRAGKTFKRKQFSWQYVELEETAIAVAGNTTDIILFNNTDWVDVNATGVKAVSLDLKVMYAWSPTTTTVAYDSWYLLAGIFALDADETGVNLSTTFANHRALWWHAEGRNTGEQPTANGASPDRRWMNWAVRKKQRFLKFDEELRLLTAFNANVNETISDARISIFGRISWETP